MSRRFAFAALASAFLCVCAGANAQGLPDPTRPPAVISAPAAAGAPAVAAGPQLQSVLIAPHPGGRRIAVIDGQTLRLGDKYKGAMLAAMTDTEVVLVQGKQRQVLKLFPPSTPR